MCTAARRAAGVSKVQTSAACSLVLYCARDRASMSWPVVGSCTTLCFVSPWPCAQPMPALRVHYKRTAATSYPERPVRLARGGRGAHARIDGQGWQPQDRKLQPPAMVPARGAHGQCLVSPCALVSQPRSQDTSVSTGVRLLAAALSQCRPSVWKQPTLSSGALHLAWRWPAQMLPTRCCSGLPGGHQISCTRETSFSAGLITGLI